MPRKKEIILVIDTETCGTLENAITYDIGMAVVERTTGKVLETRSLIVESVFYGLPALMSTAYYAKKLPQYHEGIASGKWEKVANIYNAKRIVASLVRKHGIKRIYAYNMMFDLKALNNTVKLFSGGNVKYFFPYGTEMCCILKMTRQTIGKQKGYKAFCMDNGFYYTTASGKDVPRMGAEQVFAYLRKDPNYTESHTGLEDVFIETEIMLACLKTKRKLIDYLFQKIEKNKYILPNQKTLF